MSADHGFDVPNCREHWTNGGTGITNFSEHMRPAYDEAVRRYGDSNLKVHKKAFGTDPDYGGSLHNHGTRKDLSEFWKIFYRVKKEMNLDPINPPRAIDSQTKGKQ